jgi:hypothetical protein
MITGMFDLLVVSVVFASELNFLSGFNKAFLSEVIIDRHLFLVIKWALFSL